MKMMINPTTVNNKLIAGGIFLFILLASSLLISGCGEKNVEENKEEQVAATSLQLNDGVKWQANPETTTGVNNLIQILNDFQEGENAADYKLLQTNLENEFKLIIEKCTMKGEAHDQLHLYLMPLSDLISQLDSSDPAVISTTLTDIDDHLQLYFEYFE